LVAESTFSTSELASCCTISYSHPLVRWLLGESFHPGGLSLTERLASLMGVDAESTLLDVGSGIGTTAVHLAQAVGCTVTGTTLEADGVEAARTLAEQRGVAGRVQFLRGDFLSEAFEATYDHVLMECVLSIFLDKQAALRRAYDAVQPGGALGVSDVTVSGKLPDELRGVIGTTGCVGGALSLDQYRSIADDAGFVVEHVEDCRDDARAFLRGIQGKLLMAELGMKLGKASVHPDLLAEAKRLVAVTQGLVDDGVVSYGLLVLRKPSAG